MKEQWRQQMRQKMADYRKAAPEVSWDKLDKALANNKPKAQAVPMWMRRIAAAVAVLVVVTAGYLALNRNYDEAPAIHHTVEPFVSQKTDIPQQTKDESVNLSAKIPKPLLLAAVTSEQQNPKKEGQAMESQTVQTVESQEETSDSQPQVSQPQETRPKQQTLDYSTEVHPQTTANSRLTAKIYLSNGLAGSNSDRGEYRNLKGEFAGLEIPNPTPTTTDPNNTYNNSGIHVEKHHYQPVRLGLSLRLRLNDRWSIESGLAYTRLRSDLKWSNGVNTEQKLSYVGIPVNANYLLWSSRYVNFYVTAGGMVEKMVEGRRETTYHGSIQKEYVSIHPLQFSVNGGIGAEFNLTNQFSIYAEPGLGYYFDNGSAVPTYYQDKPFNFNLNLGVRFHIK